MNSAPLQLLQVGCGNRAQEHLRAIQRSPHVELLALCDLDADKLRSTAAEFGVSHTFGANSRSLTSFTDGRLPRVR